MSHWDLDPALILPPRLQAQSPAEEIACVLCDSPSPDKGRTICVVDVNPTSGSYSEIVGQVVLPQAAGSKHHPSGGGVHRARRGAGARGVAPEPASAIAAKVLLAHDPEHLFGFSSPGFTLRDWSSAIWLWYREGGTGDSRGWASRKIIDLPGESAFAEELPEVLRLSGVVPPLVADFALSLDDCYLYVACWGTGHLRQFDVTDPLAPREIASARIGGITNGAAHPSRVRAPGGGPGAISLSRDGRRVYLSNSLSPVYDTQFYPAGFGGWMVKVDVDLCGGVDFDPNFFVDFGDLRPRQMWLQGQGAA